VSRALTTHERLVHEEAVRGSSDRAFGLVFAAVFAIVGAWPLLRGRPVRWWAVGVALVFLVAALAAPRMLAPLNRLWLKLGLLLHRIVNPVVMGFVFFSTVTPIAIVLRLRGKDLLRLRRDPAASTYWIERRPPGPAPATMTRQF
jgi:predicted membrane metal-binding protein